MVQYFMKHFRCLNQNDITLISAREHGLQYALTMNGIFLQSLFCTKQRSENIKKYLVKTGVQLFWEAPKCNN